MSCAHKRGKMILLSIPLLGYSVSNMGVEFLNSAYKQFYALVAQLDRATDFESVGREFESLRARQ